MFSNGKSTRQTGFSVIELLVVLAVVAIMVGISIPYLLNYRKLYRSDDQAIKMMDLMREAGQLALTRRRTMRLEIDLTDNALLIIDENGAAADTLVKMIPLDKPADVRVDVIPNGVTKPNPPNYANAAFAADGTGHMSGATSVTGHNVWAARFQRDGSVVNAADVPISVNLYIWPPASAGSLTPRNRKEIRAITMFGGSGAMRFWKHNGTTFVGT
jgi:prepilin-type N-terminal cleavage/methylation domain-containing protein